MMSSRQGGGVLRALFVAVMASAACGTQHGPSLADPLDAGSIVSDTAPVGRQPLLLGVSTIAGGPSRGLVDGPVAVSLFDNPVNVAVGRDGVVYVADYGKRTVAGDGVDGFLDSPEPLQAEFAEIEGLDLSPETDLLYVADGNAIKYGDFHRIQQLTLGL